MNICLNNLKLIVVAIFCFLIAGCNLGTDTPTLEKPPIGEQVVLSEFFNISPEKHYAFSWIEIYNPTDKNI